MKNLRIVNIIMTGWIPLIRKLREEEIKLLIQKSKFEWQLINEDVSPILQTKFKKEGLTVNNKSKTSCVSVWTTGSINIVGVTSEKEGRELYIKIFNEFKRLFGDIVKNKKGGEKRD